MENSSLRQELLVAAVVSHSCRRQEYGVDPLTAQSTVHLGFDSRGDVLIRSATTSNHGGWRKSGDSGGGIWNRPVPFFSWPVMFSLWLETTGQQKEGAAYRFGFGRGILVTYMMYVEWVALPPT
jgi:hypothetical protein